METNSRKSVSEDLNKFCHLAKKGDFVEVTEWSNGEGYDIAFNENIISLSHGQIEAIVYLTKHLNYNL